MYGLLVTFETTIPLADLQQPFTEYAEALTRTPGLLNKVWINNGTTVGGFHLFATKQDADAYLASDLAQGLMATEGFSNFQPQGFDVLESLSEVTGVSRPAPLTV